MLGAGKQSFILEWQINPGAKSPLTPFPFCVTAKYIYICIFFLIQNGVLPKLGHLTSINQNVFFFVPPVTLSTFYNSLLHTEEMETKKKKQKMNCKYLGIHICSWSKKKF